MEQERHQIPTVGNYIVVMLLSAIPIVNIILMIIWAIGGNSTPLWKSNLARAWFVMIAAAIVVSILFSGAIMALLASMF